MNRQEFAWLKAVAETVRACGARQPITIGTMAGKNIELARRSWTCSAAIRMPITARILKDSWPASTRCGRAGQAVRGERVHPRKPQRRHPGGGGTILHGDALGGGFRLDGVGVREGKAISTRRDRYDANGINGQGFHPFFTQRRKTRHGLEFLTEKPKQLPPWERTTR